MPTQHVNVTAMTLENRIAYGRRLHDLATAEAQVGTKDPDAAAEFVAWLARQYEKEAPK